MTAGGYQPGRPGGTVTPADVDTRIAQQVPNLIPPATSSRLYSQLAVQGGDMLTASTTAEQTYASSLTIPANTMVVGQTILVKGGGLYSTSVVAPPTQRARLRLGGATLVDSGPQNVLVSLSAARYVFDLQFIVRSLGVNGTVEATGLLHFATSLGTTVPVLGGPSGTFGDAGNPVAVNTTVVNVLALSCQFSAVLAGNSNQLRQLNVHTLRPVT